MTVLLSWLLACAAALGITTTDYGSGALSDWTVKPHAHSTPTQAANVVTGDGVAMFGDSLGYRDGRELAQRLYDRDGSLLAVDTWSSRPTWATVDALEQWEADYGLPRRVVISSGSNDIFNPPAFRAQIDRVMTIAGAERTVVWVNVHISRWDQPTSVQVADQRNSGWINAQLAEATISWPNLVVVHWAELLAGKPGYRIPTYLSDGVHTSVPLGQAARNEQIVQELT